MTKLVGQPRNQSVLPSARRLLEMGNRAAPAIAHPTWSAARDRVLTLIAAGRGLIAVLGPPGSGKTTLLRDLLSTLGERGQTVHLLAFEDSSFAVDAAGVVLVDEADRMSATRLEELCRGDGVIVIAALPAFDARLRHHHPDAAIVRLAALTPDEACAFLGERLAQLGLPMTCLTEAAWAQLIRHSHGVPRLLIALLRLTLLVAAEKHADCVTSAHVTLAVEVRNGTAGGNEAELAPAEPDFAEYGAVGAALAPAAFAGAEANFGDTMRRRWRGPAAGAALVTVGLVAAAALLTRGQMDETAPSGRNVSPVAVGMTKPPLAAARTAQADKAAPTAAATPSVGGDVTAVQHVADAGAATALGLQLPGPIAVQPPDTTPPEPAPPPQPSAAAAGPMPDLASLGSIRVVLIYPHGNVAAAKRGFELTRALRADGLGVYGPFPIASQKLKRGVMYYFAQDADAAAEIGRRLGGEYGEARLVTAGRHRPGTIEIAVGSD